MRRGVVRTGPDLQAMSQHWGPIIPSPNGDGRPLNQPSEGRVRQAADRVQEVPTWLPASSWWPAWDGPHHR